MSYTKQNWQTGDVITANKLNHIEDGIDIIPDIRIVNIEVSTSDMIDFTVQSVDQSFETIFDGIVENNEIWYGHVTSRYGDYFQTISIPLSALNMGVDRVLGKYVYMDNVTGVKCYSFLMQSNRAQFYVLDYGDNTNHSV